MPSLSLLYSLGLYTVLFLTLKEKAIRYELCVCLLTSYEKREFGLRVINEMSHVSRAYGAQAASYIGENEKRFAVLLPTEQ